MRILIAAVGRAKRSPEAALYGDYVKRLSWPVTLKEIDERRPGEAAERKRREGEQLLAALPKDARVVALDRTGKTLASEDFAALLRDWQDDGIAEAAFLIGGADGLDEAVLKRADVRLSFGPMTWPHLMARVMLAEQLYRAQSILAGHPYHRG